MATEAPQPSGDAARLMQRRRSSVLRAGRAHQHDARVLPADRAQPTRRRSSLSTLRRTAHNIESFNRNRVHRVGRRRVEPTSEPTPQRARTRSIARMEAELQQRQEAVEDVAGEEQQTEQQQTHQSVDTVPLSAEARTSPEPGLGVWKPSIVVGSPLWLEGEDPSLLDIADRKIIQARLWVEHYQGVPDFARMLQAAIQERQQLDETDPVNTRPRSTLAPLHHHAIQQRLDLLRFLLQDSEFAPERANIEAAIAGYESGEIPYSDAYTLIWAGRIVDRCPSFDSFTADRGERLERYLAEHGPGWLWYEPPLSGSGGATRGPTVLAKKGLCLENHASWRARTENMGHYRVTMGFRRRKEHVARDAGGGAPYPPLPTAAAVRPAATRYLPPRKARTLSSATTTTTPTTMLTTTPSTFSATTNNSTNNHAAPTAKTILTEPDHDGPRIFWPTLLDSGATLPCIYEADLPLLRIDRARYAAQSGRVISTAESVTRMRVYELDVGVYDDDHNHHHHGHGHGHQHQHLLRAVAPTQAIPVVALPGRASSDSERGGEMAPDRLSGLLPFHCCYVSSAPGQFRVWLGESRREVLGAARLPGRVRYTTHGPARPDALSAAAAAGGGGGDVNHGDDGAGNDRTQQHRQQQGASNPSGLRTPTRVVFEHNFVDRAGVTRVLRDEDSSLHGSSLMLMAPGGTDLNQTDPFAESVHGVHIEPKKPRRRSGMGRPQSEDVYA